MAPFSQYRGGFDGGEARLLSERGGIAVKLRRRQGPTRKKGQASALPPRQRRSLTSPGAFQPSSSGAMSPSMRVLTSSSSSSSSSRNGSSGASSSASSTSMSSTTGSAAFSSPASTSSSDTISTPAGVASSVSSSSGLAAGRARAAAAP